MMILANSVATKQVARSAKSLKLSQSGFVQMSVFSQSMTPYLASEPVPRELRLAPGRFYAFIVHGDRRWKIPVQFTEIEVGILPVWLKNVCLALDADSKPYEEWAIYGALEKPAKKIRSCANNS